MRKLSATLVALTTVALLALSGCAGLNVSWVATASYNTPATTTATMSPGVDTSPVPERK
jgi:hypothetical protein